MNSEIVNIKLQALTHHKQVEIQPLPFRNFSKFWLYHIIFLKVLFEGLNFIHTQGKRENESEKEREKEIFYLLVCSSNGFNDLGWASQR